MYERYFGTDHFPEKHDRKNAIAEMVMEIGGCSIVLVAWFVAMMMWLK